MAIIIKNINIYDADKGAQEYLGICINGGIIEALTNDQLRIDSFIRENKGNIYSIDGRGKLAMPGLINTHTHSPMTVLRNIGSNLPLQKWLFEEILPREARMTHDDVYYGSLLGQIEMIRSGTTAFVDMYEPFEILAEAVSESGLKAALSVPTLHNDWSTGDRITHKLFDKASDMLSKWNGAASGRIHVMCEVHSVYLYDHNILKDVVSFAKENCLGINMHLHETLKEINDCVDTIGVRPAEFFESIGAFDVPVIAAHCTHLNESDIDILKRHNVTAAINMTSNLKLASGIPPLPELLKAGVKVGFGTDGCASNNNLNMFEEMHIASILYKGLYRDPELISPDDVINAAFYGGEIKEGRDADIILADMSAPHLNPVNDIKSSIVYSMQGSDIDTVIVQGNLLMEKRELKTLDEEKIIFEANRVELL